MCWPFRRGSIQHSPPTDRPPLDTKPPGVFPARGGPANAQKLREFRVLVTGPECSGKESLLRRLHLDRFDPDYYDATLEEYSHRQRYQLGHGCPDIVATFRKMTLAAAYPALLDRMIQDHECVMLVYRAGDREGLDMVERVYNDYTATRQPTTYVMVVATCIDLMYANAADAPSAGREFASKHALDFVPVSAKTGEGCFVLEAVLKSAISDRLRR